jgi:hypothetical protein
MYRSWLADEGQAFEATLNLDPTTAVPTCPGWTLTDLVAHVGSYHRWVADLLHDRSRAPRSPYQLRPDPNVSLARWYRTSLELLLTAIEMTDRDTTMWTVTLDKRLHRRAVRARTAFAFWASSVLLAANGVLGTRHRIQPPEPRPFLTRRLRRRRCGTVVRHGGGGRPGRVGRTCGRP